MNERIKELQFQVAASISPLKEGSEWQREFTEKFAELIVGECCDIVGDYYGQGKKSGPGYTMICEIKEHFGVE